MERVTAEGTGENVAGRAGPRVGDLWVTSYPMSRDFRPCLVRVDNKGAVSPLLDSLRSIEDAKYGP